MEELRRQHIACDLDEKVVRSDVWGRNDKGVPLSTVVFLDVAALHSRECVEPFVSSLCRQSLCWVVL